MDAQQTDSNFILVTVYIDIIMRHFSTVQNVKLGECRILWGKRDQAAYILATEGRIIYLGVSEVTIVVGSLLWPIFASV